MPFSGTKRPTLPNTKLWSSAPQARRKSATVSAVTAWSASRHRGGQPVSNNRDQSGEIRRQRFALPVGDADQSVAGAVLGRAEVKVQGCNVRNPGVSGGATKPARRRVQSVCARSAAEIGG